MDGKNIIARLLLTALLPLAMASCRESAASLSSVTKGADGSGEVSLALSVASAYELPVTKMTDDVTQIDAGSDPAKFRGISELYVYPFHTRVSSDDPVTASDGILEGSMLELRQGAIAGSSFVANYSAAETRLIQTNRARLYEMVYVPSATDAVIVYGRATPSGSEGGTAGSLREFRRTNGALDVVLPADAAGDAVFSPVTIASADEVAALKSTAQAFADYLTGIAKVSVSLTGWYGTFNRTQRTDTWAWSSIGGNVADMGNWYQDFINGGNAIPCSSVAIAALLKSVYNNLYTHATTNDSRYVHEYYASNNDRYSSDYYYARQLATAIRTKITDDSRVSASGSGNNVTINLSGAFAGVSASNLGVPDGSLAIKWDESANRFVVAAPDYNVRLVSLEDYCYPPELWYMANSNIVTSDDNDIPSWYTASNDWAAILGNYDYGTRVGSGTTGMAVTEPLQYGPGLLEITLQPTAASLTHNGNGTVAVSNSNFPVTGIIIGDQYRQAYKFSPLSGSNYYIYDSFVMTSGGTGSYKAYISSTAAQQTIRTLVLPTFEGTVSASGEDEKESNVHIALEFLNNSSSPFVGATGTVMPGTKFYMTTTLKLKDARDSGGNSLAVGTTDRIFKSDCKTKITLRIENLKAAYNTVPDLRNPQLELGVQLIMDWIESTPSELVLK